MKIVVLGQRNYIKIVQLKQQLHVEEEGSI